MPWTLSIMNEISIKAVAGVRVPREDNPRRYITADEAVTVPDSAYYQRQIAAGDLLVIQGEAKVVASVNQGKAVKPEVDRGES